MKQDDSTGNEKHSWDHTSRRASGTFFQPDLPAGVLGSVWVLPHSACDLTQ